MSRPYRVAVRAGHEDYVLRPAYASLRSAAREALRQTREDVNLVPVRHYYVVATDGRRWTAPDALLAAREGERPAPAGVGPARGGGALVPEQPVRELRL